MVLDFLAVDNFDFTRKNVKKNLGEKLMKDFSNSVFDLPVKVKKRSVNIAQCKINGRVIRIVLQSQFQGFDSIMTILTTMKNVGQAQEW